MRVLVCLAVAAACLATPGWGRYVGEDEDESSGSVLAYPSPLRNNLEERMMVDREFVSELNLAADDAEDHDESEEESEEELLPTEDEHGLERQRRFWGFLRGAWNMIKTTAKTMLGDDPHNGKFSDSAFHNLRADAPEGLKYTMNKLSHSRNKEQGSETMDKLDDALVHGDMNVADLFRKVGVKFSKWIGSWVGKKRGLQDSSNIPNFFKDRDVRRKVNNLVQRGVITRKEAKTLIENPVDWNRK